MASLARELRWFPFCRVSCRERSWYEVVSSIVPGGSSDAVVAGTRPNVVDEAFSRTHQQPPFCKQLFFSASQSVMCRPIPVERGEIVATAIQGRLSLFNIDLLFGLPEDFSQTGRPTDPRETHQSPFTTPRSANRMVPSLDEERMDETTCARTNTCAHPIACTRHMHEETCAPRTRFPHEEPTTQTVHSLFHWRCGERTSLNGRCVIQYGADHEGTEDLNVGTKRPSDKAWMVPGCWVVPALSVGACSWEKPQDTDARGTPSSPSTPLFFRPHGEGQPPLRSMPSSLPGVRVCLTYQRYLCRPRLLHVAPFFPSIVPSTATPT